MILKYLAIVSSLIINTTCLPSDLPKDASKDFSYCAKKAEDLYHSSVIVHAAPTPIDLPIKATVPTVASQKKTPDVFEYCEPKSRTILSKYKKFSDEWWAKLFENRKSCPDYENKIISCDDILKQNPQWKEVEVMGEGAKEIIMQRALFSFQCSLERKSSAYNLACAICVGCNPNERLKSDLPHTTLHIVAMKNHYGLFNLLLRKGADANLPCIPELPIDFVPKEWKDELISYGAEESTKPKHAMSYKAYNRTKISYKSKYIK